LSEHGRAVLAALDAVADRQDASVAAVALAWLIARPGITAPIASATRPEQIDDMVQATHLKLSGEDIAALDAASAA
jgi:aryl-alcohol dehydrogenase-like predicted oxidoreductase